MKNKAVTRLLKQIEQALESMTKAKSLALNLKSKISDIRARMMIFSLLYLDKRSLLGSIRPNKLRAFLSDHHQKPQQEPSNGSEDQYQISNQVNMVLSSISNIVQDATVANQVNTGYLEEATVAAKQEEEEEDLPQSLLEELVFEDPDAGKSAIKMVRDSKELEEGEDSRLEDRIDEVAELFISRFHHQMRMQKQDSFKSLSIHPPPLPS